MSKWEKVKLGDVATYINGYAFKPQDWQKKGLPIIRIQNLTNSSSEINFYDGNIDEKYIISNGDILISWSASLGVYEWNNGKAILNQHIFKVIFNKIQVNKRYFLYVVNKLLTNIDGKTHGSTMKHITKPLFNNLPFPLPPLEEQHKIASILDTVSEALKLRKQQLSELDLLVKSKFIEMFGDPFTNNKGWVQSPFSELCDKIGDGLHGTPKYDDKGDYYFINGNNFREKAIVITPETRRVSKSEHNKHYIEFGDNTVFLSINGTLGNTAFYNNEPIMLGKSACYSNLGNSITRDYVMGLFMSDTFQTFMNKASTGSTIKNFGLKALRELLVVVPPMELQQKYTKFVKQIDTSKSEVQKSIDQLQTLFDSLMQQYFEYL